MDARRRLALIGFVGHAPGLWLFARHELGPVTRRWNKVAGGLTLLAMAAGAAAHGWVGLGATWLVGHFAWSLVLALQLLTNGGRE